AIHPQPCSSPTSSSHLSLLSLQSSPFPAASPPILSPATSPSARSSPSAPSSAFAAAAPTAARFARKADADAGIAWRRLYAGQRC
ncbi:hypothetical protein EXIGLDRAFT_832556, partial [Exidia glandulosa HHB12029]